MSTRLLLAVLAGRPRQQVIGCSSQPLGTSPKQLYTKTEQYENEQLEIEKYISVSIYHC